MPKPTADRTLTSYIDGMLGALEPPQNSLLSIGCLLLARSSLCERPRPTPPAALLAPPEPRQPGASGPVLAPASLVGNAAATSTSGTPQRPRKPLRAMVHRGFGSPLRLLYIMYIMYNTALRVGIRPASGFWPGPRPPAESFFATVECELLPG